MESEYNIKFDEEYYSAENEELTIYFLASLDLIKSLHPDKYEKQNLSGTEISIKISRTPSEKDKPLTLENFVGGLIEVSPTRLIDGCYTDYDWNELIFTNENICQKLFEIYKKVM